MLIANEIKTIDLEATDVSLIRIDVLRKLPVNKHYIYDRSRVHSTDGILYNGNNPIPALIDIESTFANKYPSTYDNLKHQLNAHEDNAKITNSNGRYTKVRFVDTGNPHAIMANIRTYMRKIIRADSEHSYRLYISGHNEVGEDNVLYAHYQRPEIHTKDFIRKMNSILPRT